MRFQPTVATSLTEVEFVAASDAANMTLYLQSLLHDQHVLQHEVVVIYKDNPGAYNIVSAGQPTPFTRHIDMHHFVLLDWAKHNLIHIEQIRMSMKSSDALTKSTQCVLFYHHADDLLGRLPLLDRARVA